MAPDRTKTIRGFFIFHLPIISDEEDTMDQVWYIAAAGAGSALLSSLILICVGIP
jgi:hypothetical protein